VDTTRIGLSADNADLGFSSRVRSWLRYRSARADDWTASELCALKGERTVTVVIPARDEERTVGRIVKTIRTALMEEYPLVDDVLVVDSRSRDNTARVAAEAGARVVAQDTVLQPLPDMHGKGEALWKGLAATTGDLVVFVDGDLYDFTAEYVIGLLGPLLTDPGVDYVKGFYQRPLVHGSQVDADGGGRVTELVARPLLNMYWPDLAGFVQPLAGEYAGRREVLESIPFVTHYGVEVAHLIDLLRWRGLEAFAQVDLGMRTHRHQSTHALGQMAGQIMLTIMDRLDRSGRLVVAEPPSALLAQFRRSEAADGAVREWMVTDLTVRERPPLRTVRPTGRSGPPW
jgi:glucosyl-3-phosphoglycerate synthase